MITILICKSQVKNTGPAQLSKFGLPKWIHYDEKGAPYFLTFIRQSIAVLVRNNEKSHFYMPGPPVQGTSGWSKTG